MKSLTNLPCATAHVFPKNLVVAMKDAKQRRELRLTAANMDRIYLNTGGRVSLNGLGVTLNDVTCIQREEFVPFAELPEITKNNPCINDLLKFVRRDDVVNNLRIHKEFLIAKSNAGSQLAHEESLAIVDATIKALMSTNDEFISTEQLRSFEIYSQNLVFYVSSYELATKVPSLNKSGSPEAQAALSLRPSVRHAAKFAFKRGSECIRELMAAKLAKALGFEELLVPKYPLDLRGTLLNGKVATEGLASEWLADGVPIKLKDWENLEQTRIDVAQGALKNSDFEAELASLKLKELNSAQKTDPHWESVQEQALLDLLLCSNDSHTQQYLVEDQKIKCFDFARFLAPAYTFIGRDNQTYLAFRSAFLDHPAAREPLSRETINKLQALDWDVLEAQMRKEGMMAWDETAFLVGGDLFQSYNNNREEQKYIRRQGFGSIHPHARDLMKERIQRIQDRLSKREPSTSTVSTLDLFAAAMPEVFTLCSLYSRIAMFPALTISVTIKNNKIAFQSLECAVAAASLYLNHSEKQAAQTALAALRAKASTYAQLALTMEL